jgi:hypothetical protein
MTESSRLELRNQRFGDGFFMGTLKLILGVAVFLALALVGIKVIPPFFSNYELEDAIKTEALQSTYTTRTEDDVREAIIKQARSYDIALTPKQVHVSRVGGFGTGSLTIEADYSVPVELPGYSTTLEFHLSSKNKGVY